MELVYESSLGFLWVNEWYFENIDDNCNVCLMRWLWFILFFNSFYRFGIYIYYVIGLFWIVWIGMFKLYLIGWMLFILLS